MAVEIFGDLSIQFFNHMREKRYEAAFDLITMHGMHFPEEAWHVYDWHIAAAAACQNERETLRVFEEAVEKGYWYPVDNFQDEYYAPYRNHPTFERLVATCGERHEQALAAAKSDLFIKHPEGKPPYPLLIAIHRNHSNVERCLPDWESALEDGWAVAMPQSSQIMGPQTHIWNNRELAVEEVLQHYHTLMNSGTYDPERIVWTGYMTGADIALRALSQPPVQGRGFIAMSPVVSELEVYAELVNRSPTIYGYIFVGEANQRCYPGAVQLADTLRSQQIPVLLETLPNHTFGYLPDLAARLQNALAFIMQGS